VQFRLLARQTPGIPVFHFTSKNFNQGTHSRVLQPGVLLPGFHAERLEHPATCDLMDWHRMFLCQVVYATVFGVGEI
jgi:hypothetical protein